MLFFLSLVLALAFSCVFQPWITRRPSVFYGLTVAFILLLFASYYTGIYGMFPAWFTDYIVMLYARGSLSTAVFAIVMYLGVVPLRFGPAKRLMRIRGEISIIGSILALGHNIYYGIYYFAHLFTAPGELAVPYRIATILSLVLIAIMLPLMVTSFRSVRKRMAASGWKRLQRLAYAFYALLYAHVMVVLCANIRGASTLISIAAYSLVFLPYFVLRIRKYALACKARTRRIQPS